MMLTKCASSYTAVLHLNFHCLFYQLKVQMLAWFVVTFDTTCLPFLFCRNKESPGFFVWSLPQKCLPLVIFGKRDDWVRAYTVLTLRSDEKRYEG